VGSTPIFSLRLSIVSSVVRVTVKRAYVYTSKQYLDPTHKENVTSPAIKSIPTGKKLKKEKGPPKNAKWTVANDQALIMVLKAQQLLGNQADNSWKRLVWVATVKELTGSERLSGGAPKKEKSCSDRWSTVCLSF
jgi:hypothetical protein